ncbi:galactokinase [Neolewinella xylanilytica]|uniref:Galactokinase n=1 Tax=Neolewinella xylanilytica TaxID=1514080 RepID=A0A2S6I608_9BACT|nr:galactokinase [Neolewinella xylanilytica]PPK86597.1 galactokinase [Neolewinella xylanilytica]
MKASLPGHVTQYLKDKFGEKPEAWTYALRSPGRVNIIGEHVDYTGGLVMPAGINYAIYFLARRIEAPEWRLHAVDLDERVTLPLPLTGRSGTLWADYLAGIGVQFQDQGQFLPGLEVVFGGDLPRGSGMSSSAALEGGMAFLLNALLNTRYSRPALAALCQRSSNTYLGIPSGIMDQFASLNGSESGPIILNCHTLSSEPVKNALENYGFVLVNSMVSHNLSDGAYAQRVAECQRALEAIQSVFPRVTHLSATLPDQLQSVSDRLDDTARKRATYVVDENKRVTRAVIALEAGSSIEVGNLLNATHAGLRDLYEVSCDEIDFLQAFAEQYPGVAGSRLMGGGFGGCTINLVKLDRMDDFKADIVQAYEEAFGIGAECYPVVIRGGTDFL